MSSSPATDSDTAHPAVPTQLKVSAQERVAGMLIALLMLLGMAVAILFTLWLASSAIVIHPPIAVEIVEELGGRESQVVGAASELDPPGADEIELDVPPQLSESLAAVTDAISTERASLEDIDGPTDATGSGSGQGDARAEGGGGGGTADVIPRGQRWEIRFASSSQEAYAAQLDFFNIELGVFGGGQPVVEYASKLSQEKPAVRTTQSGAEETRLNLGWLTGSLQEFDQQLLAKASISSRGRMVRQFYSHDVENRLASLEKQHSGNRDLREIAKTVFGVRAGGEKFEFYIIEQRYRTLP